MYSLLVLCCFFFFQAEDGIRDLVRSRGLGDVYKRQVAGYIQQNLKYYWGNDPASAGAYAFYGKNQWFTAVSYTHLTLPTSDLV